MSRLTLAANIAEGGSLAFASSPTGRPTPTHPVHHGCNDQSVPLQLTADDGRGHVGGTPVVTDLIQADGAVANSAVKCKDSSGTAAVAKDRLAPSAIVDSQQRSKKKQKNA